MPDKFAETLTKKNIGVDPQSARVTLVDTDSYHITDSASSRVYRCEVGLPEYLPREIQEKMKNGQTLATASLPTFSKYSDLFALAVHIFALLMNGCHPFACARNNKTNIGPLSQSQPSVVVPQPIDNIVNGFFPFHTKKTVLPRRATHRNLILCHRTFRFYLFERLLMAIVILHNVLILLNGTKH